MEREAYPPGDDASTRTVLGQGSRVGRYEVLELLGSGGMGAVYRARDSSLERDVALKCPWRDLTRNPAAVERFAREGRSAAKLSHPNIVPVYEVLEHDGLPWIAMQYVTGQNLSALLSGSGPPATDDLLRWAEQLAEALCHAHRHQVLHRDIKPANVLISAEGRALLADFGVAQMLPAAGTTPSAPTTPATLTRTGAAVGTRAYMSPEQSLGHSLDERSDIFSFGVLLQEMATGRRFLDPRTTGSGSGEIPSARAVNPLLPGELEPVIRRAIAWDPEDRYQNAEALLEDLRRVSALWRSRRRRRRWLRSKPAALTGALLLITIAALTTIWLRRPAASAREPNVELVATPLVTSAGYDGEGRLSNDGRWLSFVSSRDGLQRIWLRSIDGEIERPLTPPERFAISHVRSEDGRSIAFLGATRTDMLLQEIPALGGPAQRSVRLPRSFLDGRLIRWIGKHVFAQVGPALMRIDLDTEEVVTLLGSSDDAMARGGFDVRSDGKRIAFHAGWGASFSIWTSAPDGDHALRLTQGESSDWAPKWMGREGRSVVYTSNRSGQIDLWRSFLPDGVAERITLSAATETVSDVSADGSVLIFNQMRETVHLWALELRSGDESQLTSDALNDLWPTVSSGVDTVFFQRAKPRLDHVSGMLDARILKGTLRDGALREVETAVNDGIQPSVSPNRRWLTYVRGRERWVEDLTTGHAIRVAEDMKPAGMTMFPIAVSFKNLAWFPSGDAFVMVDPSGSGDRIQLLEPGARQPVPRTLVTGPSGATIRDLRVSADGAQLVYAVDSPSTSELRRFSIADSADRALLADEARLVPAGWNDDGSLLVAARRMNADGVLGMELVAVDPNGERRMLAATGVAFIPTLTFDPASRACYVTASDAEDVHNLVRISLDDGAVEQLTGNRLPDVSFSKTHLINEQLVYARQQVDNDIWMIEFDSQE